MKRWSPRDINKASKHQCKLPSRKKKKKKRLFLGNLATSQRQTTRQARTRQTGSKKRWRLTAVKITRSLHISTSAPKFSCKGTLLGGPVKTVLGVPPGTSASLAGGARGCSSSLFPALTITQRPTCTSRPEPDLLTSPFPLFIFPPHTPNALFSPPCPGNFHLRTRVGCLRDRPKPSSPPPASRFGSPLGEAFLEVDCTRP